MVFTFLQNPLLQLDKNSELLNLTTPQNGQRDEFLTHWIHKDSFRQQKGVMKRNVCLLLLEVLMGCQTVPKLQFEEYVLNGLCLRGNTVCV